MTIFNVLTLLGGLALFLYGMNVMGDGLKKLSGGKLESILRRLTSSPLKGVLLGLVVTAIIQSSSATTVMVVGFVNSGIMQLSRAVGVIMGANIGTTVTSWIISLAGIQGESLVMQLLEPSSFSPVFAFVGIILVMFSRSEKKNDVGTILLGFAVLMTGMMSMSGAVAPLANVPEFREFMIMFSNPILGLLAGAVLTAIIQSSSASVGILQALCATGTIHYSVAFPIIMGQNIGTCITAILSSMGANRNSKRAALIHLFFNLIGTTLFMAVFYTLNIFVDFAFLDTAADEKGIAIIHSCFNICATIVLLPMHKALVKLAYLVLPIKENEKEKPDECLELLDVRFLEEPAFAVSQTKQVSGVIVRKLIEYAKENHRMIDAYDQAIFELLKKKGQKIEDEIDYLNDYLVKITGRNLSNKDLLAVSTQMQAIGELKGMTSKIYQVSKAIRKLDKRMASFPDAAKEELHIVFEQILLILKNTCDLLEDNVAVKEDVVAEQIRELKRTIKHLKRNHIERVQTGICTSDAGMAYLDILSNYEQLNFYCKSLWDESKERT